MTERDHRPLGVGIYSRSEAARLLKMTPSRVTRWLRGYSYWRPATSAQRHEQPPVVRSNLRPVGGALVLSFLDLMELRVIHALVDEVGLSLQQIRAAARVASDLFGTHYPFATRRVYHDQVTLFARLSDDAVVELSKRDQQLISAHVFEPYLTEVDFDPASSLANRWWPLGRAIPIVLDPRVAFGAPVVAGTATRTDVIATVAETTSPDEAAHAYRMERRSVQAAIRFESELRAAA